MEDETQWKKRIQQIYKTCQDELKKTTEIGKKMLSASKTNSCLHESYEELGVLVQKEIKNGKLQWNNSKVEELIKKIDNCEKDLSMIEKEVNKIKFSSAPVNISKDINDDEEKNDFED